MRKRASSGGVTVQGIAGTHAIFFGLDLDPGVLPGCLGFAVHRQDHTESEEYWLSGFKTFQSIVPNPDPKQFYSSHDHPIQSFYWGDYTAKPGHDYTYRFVPRYGAPGSLTDQDGVEASIDISTGDPTQGVHGVYFNRGVAASQAYAVRFGSPPDELPDVQRQAALTWLSRGLAEAIAAFIGQASGPGFAIRAAAYEFTEPGVLAAFGAAEQAGADVKVVYHARSDTEGDQNRKAIAAAALDPAILIPRTKAKIAHNKFIVLCEKGDNGALTPVSVWTGSTNFSEGGIYGHSNVGHAVRDGAVAARFLDYWGQLAGDPDVDSLRDWVSANSPFDAGSLGSPGIHTLFSPRHGLDPLNWYADRFGSAGVVANITEAFGMGKVFEDQLTGYAGDALHYVMLDKRDDHQDVWSADHKVFVAVGSSGGPTELSRWAKETLTGFNPMVPYLHTKILLVDPLSADPTVITGSANFSPDSTSTNDENMLVIRGDTEVADIYFSEFTRIFQHFYARWWASQLSKGPADAQTHSFLVETDAWQAPYVTVGSPKQLVVDMLNSKVEANV
jgi:phosphatidylserine/phosphatidylglycerophosphate/cardiolipin synthase-like enzyme